MEEKRKRDAELEAQQRQRAADADQDSDMSDVDDDDPTAHIHMPYDVYVKDAGRSSGFFKQSQAHRMYPVYEARYRVDDYGEVVDAAVFSKLEAQHVPDDMAPMQALASVKAEDDAAKAAALASAAAAAAAAEAAAKDDEPSKYIEEDATLVLRCGFQYIDFEGRSDGRSMKNIVAQVAPRKLLLVHGVAKACQEFAEHCIKTSVTAEGDVFCPGVNDCINVSSARNLYQVVLTDPLVNALQMAKLNDYQLGYVSGVIKTQASSTGATRALLDVLPLERRRARRPAVVGELKLTEVRQLLQGHGFSTRFAPGGVLVVNESVVIRRAASRLGTGSGAGAGAGAGAGRQGRHGIGNARGPAHARLLPRAVAAVRGAGHCV
ncbi:beta-lactamase-like protein, partial [Entophlyctis helioformis]